MTTTKTIAAVKGKAGVQGFGWARGVRCAAGHSGNRRLYRGTPRGYWACAGCGHAYHESEVAHRQAHAGGANMAGGLYDVAEADGD